MSKRNQERKIIRVIFETQIGLLDDHKINVASEFEHLTNAKERDFLNEAEYSISFEMPWKDFKKKITDIKLSGATDFTFTKDGPTDRLTINYTSKNKDVSTHSMFMDEKKINLQSALRDDETFRVSIQLDDIRAISTALLADDVRIYLDESRDVLLISQMNKGAIEVRTLIKTVDGI